MKRMKYSTRQKLVGLLFVAPWIIGFVLFTMVPFVQTIQYSFNEVRFRPDGIAMTPVGLDNFANVLYVDPDFKMKIAEYVKLVFLFVPMVVVFSVIIAVLLNTKMRGRRIFRAIYFLPVILISGPVLDNLNEMGATTLKGVNNFFIYEFIEENFPSFLSTPILYIFSSVVLFLWFSGVQILILLSGLQKTDPSIYEALSIDGASAWQQFWKMTMPTLKPFIFLITVYTIVDVSNSDTNPLISIIQRAMFNGQKGFGFAAAATWIYFFMIVIAVVLAYLLLGREKHERFAKVEKHRKRRSGK